jgi:prepilin-type N-terminal cleavage/methylation domain-containing protein
MMMHRPSRGGFSLIELVITLTVGGIIAGTVVMVMISQLHLNSTHNRNMANQQNLRDSFNYMMDEISLCGNGIADQSVYVTESTASSFRFMGDVNGDGNWDEVEYAYADGSLSRTIRSSPDGGVSWGESQSDVILDDLDSVVFTFYAPGNVVAANEMEISSVAVALTLSPGAGSTAFTAGRTRAFSQSGRVTLRNRMAEKLFPEI